MRLPTTLALLALVAGLLAYILGYERDTPGTQEKLARQTHPFTFAPSDPDQIDITTPDKVTISLLRDNERWQMNTPLQDSANLERITALIEALSKLEWFETFKRKDLARGDFDNTGFNDPTPIVVLKKAGVTLAALRIGSPSAIEGATYVTSDLGEDIRLIHLTRTPLADLLPIAADLWRDPRLLRFKPDALLTFSIDAGPNVMEFERPAPGKSWNLTKPLRCRASDERLNAILAAILNMETTPVSGGPAAAEASSPPLKIRLAEPDAEPRLITLHASNDPEQPVHAEVSGRPGFYQGPAGAHDLWKLQPNHLRDQHLARITPETVTSLRLLSPNYGEVRMEKEGENWLLKRFGQTGPAHKERIAQLFNRLNIEQIREFVSDAATNLTLYGLKDPFLQVTWTSAGTETTLQFGTGEKNAIFARYTDEPYIYRVSPLLFNALPPDATKWRGLKIVDVSLFAVRRLIISQGEAPPLTLHYDPDNATWSGTLTDNDITPRLETAAANQLLQQLANLEVTDWSTDRRDAYAALKNPTLTLQILLIPPGAPDSELKTHTLIFAPTQPGRQTAVYHGRLDQDPDTFLITRDLYQQLTAPLVKVKSDK